MRGLQALLGMKTQDKKRRSGQSLIEMALALPVMLIMISGLIEFGFALNQYLNALDAAREGARYATDGDPLDRDLVGGVSNTDCGTTLDFYMQAACIANNTMEPVDFNATTDDVVISVFRVLSGTVIDRWPNCEPDPDNDCPFDPPSFPETMGEWHLFGRGDGCGNGLDDDDDGRIDDGCPSGPPIEGTESEYCNPDIDDYCHPSRLTLALVQSKIEVDAPDSAVLAVEVFYDYPHVLQLPWITPFVPNPLPLHTYTILPLPAAEPSLTITGTVTRMWNGSPQLMPGVTINFNNGMTAITDENGMYLRTGLPSGFISWSADPSGIDCEAPSIPDGYTEHLTTFNLTDKDFLFTDCGAEATQTAQAAASQTQAVTLTFIAGTATSAQSTLVAGATETAAAQATAGVPTNTPMPATATNTAPPGCLDSVISPNFSQVSVVNPSPPETQADGSSTLEVQVTLFNECNTTVNMSDRTVTLTSSRGGSETIAPSSALSDVNGQATFTVRSSVMSDWDPNHHDFSYSTYTAVADGVTIANTAGGAFKCVGMEATTSVNSDEVIWRFTNDSGIDRRLVQVALNWVPQFDPSFALDSIVFDALQIWSQVGGVTAPATINSGWSGAPADRHITTSETKDFVASYNFSVASSGTFTLNAEWDNTSGTSNCTSISVPITP